MTAIIPKICKKCQICQETTAHGNHFGVLSCRACAAFFRRTANSRWSKLRCQGGSCNGFSFLCKPCRLQRCFERGMATSNFQFNRDVKSTVARRTTVIPDTVESLLGRPYLVTLKENFKNPVKTFVDLRRLLEETSTILNSGLATPTFSENQLKKMSIGLKGVESKRMRKITKMDRNEVFEFWEFYFKKCARWLNHFEEFTKLDEKLKMQLLQTIWHVWSRLEKLSTTAKYRKICENLQKTEIVIQENQILDIEKVDYDSSWLSDFPNHQLRRFMLHASCDQFDVTDSLGLLNPTDVELSFMLAELCFRYAQKRHQGGILEAICEKFVEKLANDLHKYYVEDLEKPRYSERLAKMMQINNKIQKNIRDGRVRMEVVRTFRILKLEFTHPEMFLDSGYL